MITGREARARPVEAVERRGDKFERDGPPGAPEPAGSASRRSSGDGFRAFSIKGAAIFVRAGLIREDEIARFIALQRPGESLPDVLIRERRASEEQIARAFAQHYGYPYIALADGYFDPRAFVHMSEEQATQYVAIPVSVEADGSILLAVADPLDRGAKEALEFRGLKVRLRIATPTAIREAIRTQYRTARSVIEVLRTDETDDHIRVVEGERESFAGTRQEILDLWTTDSAPAVKAANALLRDAILCRASDIHIEPGFSFVRIRYRIDGVLNEPFRLPKWVQAGLTSRFKVLAELDIAEHRVPQDGRFRLKVGARDIDLRISTLPTRYGEKVVLRLLDPECQLESLDRLGFPPGNVELIREALGRSQGMILATGPTGSGKTSTLFAGLRELTPRPLNIVTIENPIEYEIPGLNQVQVNEKAGLSFATTLRSILRQDPNVILVGEVRDRETAKVAFEASLTGHLVLTTLHTKDAPNAVTRLLELGVEPYIVGSALELIIAQRLVRRVCERCSTIDAPKRGLLQRLALEEDGVYHAGRGCEHCLGTGFHGRTVVAEVLAVDAAIRAVIVEGSDVEGRIRKALRAQLSPSLIDDAARLCRAGVTSVSEVLRVVEVASTAAATCGQCGFLLEADFTVCPRCARELRRACRECDEPLSPTWSVCPYCGAAAAGSSQAQSGRREEAPTAAQRPLAADDSGPIAASALMPSAPDTGLPDLSFDEGIRILIVDDDPVTRKLLTLFLRRSKHKTRVRAAASGAEALAAIASELPAVIILDFSLPDTDGVEVCKAIRKSLRTAFIPVLMMTATAEEEIRVRAVQAGTDEFISKPIDPMDLLARIDALLARIYGV